jgi:DNA topoisomerase-1
MQEKWPAITAEIAKDRTSKDEGTRGNADVAWLVSEMWIRVGSDKENVGKVPVFGATTLRAKHVVVNGDKVRLQFVAKKGAELDLPVTNPELAKMLIARKKAASKDGPMGYLFNVTDKDFRKYSQALANDSGFNPHNFRTRGATEYAGEIMAALKTKGLVVITKPEKKENGKVVSPAETKRVFTPPQNAKEYKKWTMGVSAQVGQRLGDNPGEALKSYINPVVFSSWQDNLED